MDNAKADTIKLVHDTHRAEINYHRDVLSSVFQWTTSLLIAMGAGLVVGGERLVDEFGVLGQVATSIAVAAMVAAGVLETRHGAAAMDMNAQVVVKADRLLHLFEEAYFDIDESMYPQEWLGWGDSLPAAWYTPYSNAITGLLGLGLLALIWGL